MQLCMTLLIISTPLPFCTNMFSSRSFICVDDPSFVDLYCDNYFSLLKSSIVDLYTHFWFVLDVYLVPSHIFFPFPLHENGFMFVASKTILCLFLMFIYYPPTCSFHFHFMKMASCLQPTKTISCLQPMKTISCLQPTKTVFFMSVRHLLPAYFHIIFLHTYSLRQCTSNFLLETWIFMVVFAM